MIKIDGVIKKPINVVLKKCKPISKPKIRRDPNQFEAPTIEELQSTLSRLRPTK